MKVKILTIRQPYAHQIVFGDPIDGFKDIENRSWKANYRGPVLILAGVNRTEPIPPQLRDAQLQYGGIIGAVDVTGCVRSHPSKWFKGPFGFSLVNPRALTFISWPGAQGFRDAPEELIKRIGERELREGRTS